MSCHLRKTTNWDELLVLVAMPHNLDEDPDLQMIQICKDKQLPAQNVRLFDC